MIEKLLFRIVHQARGTWSFLFLRPKSTVDKKELLFWIFAFNSVNHDLWWHFIFFCECSFFVLLGGWSCFSKLEFSFWLGWFQFVFITKQSLLCSLAKLYATLSLTKIITKKRSRLSKKQTYKSVTGLSHKVKFTPRKFFCDPPFIRFENSNIPVFIGKKWCHSFHK